MEDKGNRCSQTIQLVRTWIQFVRKEEEKNADEKRKTKARETTFNKDVQMSGVQELFTERGKWRKPVRLSVCLSVSHFGLRVSCLSVTQLTAADKIFYKQLNAVASPSFLAAFAKLRKATVSFLMSVRMELGSHWTYFHKILYSSFFFRNFVQKTQVSLKSDTNSGYFT